MQIGRGLHAHQPNPGGRLDLELRGDERHLRPAGDGRAGELDALQPAAAVADEADRIPGLPRAARAHEHLQAAQVVARCPAQQVAGRGDDGRRVGQAPGAGVRAGEPTLGRLQDDDAPLAELGDIAPGRRVLPHLGVHGRGQHDRAPRGEQHIRQQVVRDAVGGAGDEIGGGRDDEDEIGLLAQADVPDLVGPIPDGGGDGSAGQRRPGRLADEVQCGSRGRDRDVVARLAQTAQDLDGLVGGDAAGHPKNNRPAPMGAGLCRGGGQAVSSTASETSRPASISRRAMDSGFS